jgi:hypothetical protein
MNSYSTEQPRFHILIGDKSDVDRYAARLRFGAGSEIAVRVLRGQNMEHIESFYDELAAVLQFPLYFGRNWAALDECLSDLEWLPADAYLLILANAPSILKSAGSGDAEAFLKLLSQTCSEWASGSSLGGGLARKPKPFHVVFHAEVVEAEQFLDRVEAATGEPISKIVVSS